MPTNIDDKELARMEELAAHEIISHRDACNAVPALVAEVRGLRVINNMRREACEKAIKLNESLFEQNSALREKVEALEWFVEVRKFGLSRMYDDISNDAAGELLATTYAAREAVNADPED